MPYKTCGTCRQSKPLTDFKKKSSHLDGSTIGPGCKKRGDVMRMVRDGFSLQNLADEIAKCDGRCRNCHAIVTLE